MKRQRPKNPDDKPDPREDNGFAEFGGYMEAKKAKLREQFRQDTSNKLEQKTNIFSGVSILVNGYTKPSAEELKDLIGEHGGMYHHYQVLGGGTTHIIASNLPNVKINKLGSVPIVKPNWIVDSIENGRLLDFKKYLLYTNQSRTQPRLNLPLISKPKDDELNLTESNHSKTDLITTVNKALIANINSNEGGKRAKDATDPTFLTDFYNNSRLHLIATLGAEFKQLVNQMREKSDGLFIGLNKLKNKIDKIDLNDDFKSGDGKVIMHIDMDCFFVSVGLRSRPELRGKAVAVTHSRGGNAKHRPGVDRQAEIDLYEKRLPDRSGSRLNKIDNSCSLSEIASCSYEARRCGIKNGMFMGPALQLCPDLVAIPYDFECYKEVSHALYKTIAQYTLNIEAVSCDEMYVDITIILQTCNMSVEDWASHIRNEISEITGCPCSTGFGSNRLQARLATKKAKPNGQFYLRPEEVENYFYEVSLGDIPGVGYATLSKLKGLGLETCGDVQNTGLTLLQSELGQRFANQLLEQSKGIDKKPLQYEHERKSVSAEMNYGIRFKTNKDVHDFFENLSKEVHSRLLDTGMRSRCVTLKLMVRAAEAPIETAKYLGHGVCDSLSRSSTLSSSMCDQTIILKETKSLYEKLTVLPEDIRGVGIQLSRLEKSAPINKTLSKFLTRAKENNQENEQSHCNQSKSNVSNTTMKPSTLCLNKLDVQAKKAGDTTKSKRGRPKKIDKVDVKGNQNKLGHYFKVKGHTETASLSGSCSQNNQIDLTVLNELPENIRGEIMKEYDIQENGEEFMKGTCFEKVVKTESNELDQDFLKALPEDIRMEILRDHNSKNVAVKIEDRSKCKKSVKPLNKVQKKKSVNLKGDKSSNGSTKRNVEVSKISHSNEGSNELDQDFLDSLPEDIRDEILRDYKFKNKSNLHKTAAVETVAKDEIQQNIEDKKQSINEKEVVTNGTESDSASDVENNFDYSSLNAKDFKNIMRNWLQTETSPLEFDIKFLSDYFYRLAVTRQIEILFTFVKFLLRNINKKFDCAWHKAFYVIVNHLQEGMIKQYDYTLHIPGQINCACCL